MFGHDNYEVATSLRNLGDTRRARGELPLALAHHAEALRLRQQLLGAAHPGVAEALVDLGSTQQALQEYSAANDTLRQAIAAYEHINATPQVMAAALLHAGEVALALGHAPEAVAYLERAHSFAGLGDPPFANQAMIVIALNEAKEACRRKSSALRSDDTHAPPRD